MLDGLSFQNQKSLILEQLRYLAKKNGFITVDDILSNELTASLSIDELDRINEALLDLGVIIRVTDEDFIEKDSTENVVDRSHIDYEVIFQRVIKIDSDLEPYINELRQIVPPRMNEENVLVSQAIEGDKNARERLISMFLKVVVRMALWFYEKYSLSLSDTIQNGNVGLILSVEKFAQQKDNRFSTYAPWWIRQQMGRYAQYSFDELFYFPIHMKDKLLKIYDIKNTIICNDCSVIYTCPNILDHITKELSIDRKTAKKYLSYFKTPISIEHTINNLGSQDFFSDQGKFMDYLHKKIDRFEQQNLINRLFEGLKDREIIVIKKRYGLDNEVPMTLEEIAQEYGLTRERIRQIEALGKTRIGKNYYRTVYNGQSIKDLI